MKEKQDSVLVARIPKQLKKKIVEASKEQEQNISTVVRDVLKRRFDD